MRESKNFRLSTVCADGRDALDSLVADLLSEDLGITVPTRRVPASIDSRMESILSSVKDQKIRTKALPLVMRKRLLYELALHET